MSELEQRTCRIVVSEFDGLVYEYELSCGHVVTSTKPEPPNYCPNCGAKVVSE